MGRTLQISDKLKRLERLFSQNGQDRLLNLTISKLFDIEKTFCKEEINRLKGRMRNFEKKYKMTSTTFMEKWEKGRLDDREDYFVWASLCNMHERTLCKIRTLGE